MKARNPKLVILYILIIFVLIFSGALYYYKVHSRDLTGNHVIDDAKIQCENSGGAWIEFPNTCVDSCDLERNPEIILCGQAFTFGCDCGSDMCWNGESCEAN